MRKIKFRGLRVDGEGFAYGDLIRKYDKTYIGRSVKRRSYGRKDVFIETEVIPETVGQYTGLKDENGIEIYEDDIVMEEDYSNGGFLTSSQPKEKKIVKYRTDGAVGFKCGFNINVIDNLEVVGNIHETNS